MQEALSDLRRALERPLRAGPRDRHDARGQSSTASGDHQGFVVEVDWHGESTVPADLSRSHSRYSRRRCATSPSTRIPHAWRSRSRATRTRSRSRFVTTAPAPGAGDPGMGLRLAAFEALQQGGVVEFGPVDDGRWRVRLTVPLMQDQRDADVLEPEEF